MTGQTAKYKVNIGLTSLILIFIILCLATFSLLSLSSAEETRVWRSEAPRL